MLLTSRTDSFRSANSVSDATSLPMDPASMVPRTAQQQTQTEEGWPTPREDIGIGTEEEEGEGEATKGGKKMESRGTQMRPTITNKRVDTEGLVERKESGIGTDEEEAKRRKKQESRGTQMRPTIMNNKRVDTAGLVVRKESGIGTEPAAKMECREAQTEDEEGGKKKRRGKGRLARDDSIDEERAHNHRGVQYSPPALRHAKCQTEPMAIQECLDWVEGPSQQRERSESVQVVIGDEMDQLMDMAYPERRSRPEKRDLVIQTDDSYLRIARRLDNLRTAKSEINVYCTGVGIPKRAQSGPGRRKSLRFLEPAVQQIRDSFRRHGKGGKKMPLIHQCIRGRLSPILLLLATFLIVQQSAQGMRQQAVAVKGILLCGGRPASGVKVKLWDEDDGPDPDDVLDEGYTDGRGGFQLRGSTRELTTIDPVFKIYHDCDDGILPGQRKVKLRIPNQYISSGGVARRVFDIGVLNLETRFGGEERDIF